MHLSEKQQIIVDNLRKFDPRLESIYLSAFKVLEDKRNPERIPQSAHSIREVLNVLSRLSGVSYKQKTDKETQEDSNFRKKLVMVLDPSKGLPQNLQRPYINLIKIHGWFTAVSHHRQYIPNEQEYLEKINEFHTLLLQFFSPYFDTIDQIDQILQKNHPGKRDFEKLKDTVRYFSAYKYFFERAGSGWLSLLRKEGFFQKAPSAILREDSEEKFKVAKGMVGYPVETPEWPESKFLVRVANKRPKDVFEIISKCGMSENPNEQNPLVIRNFVEAANNMNHEYSSKMASLIIKRKWLGFDFLSDDGMIKLAVRLVKNGNEKDYEVIIDKLLDVGIKNQYVPTPRYFNPKGEPKFEQYVGTVVHFSSYIHIIKEILPLVVKKSPLFTTDVLIRKLSKAINFRLGLNKENKYFESNSDLWRYAIEDHEHNNEDIDVKSLLVTALRDSLIEIISTKDEQVRQKCVDRMAKEKFAIFRRLELHFYRNYPQFFESEIHKAVFKFQNHVEVFHEYYLLLKEHFGKLPKTLQNRYFRLVDRGPDEQLFNKFRKEGQFAKVKFKDFKERWIALMLEPIEDYLPAQVLHKYQKHIRKVGRQSFGGFLYVKSVNSSDSVNINRSQLSESMTPEDATEFIRTYQPLGDKADIFEDPNAIKFEELVTKNPSGYSKVSEKLVGAHPIFIHNLFSGLNKALTPETVLEWDSIISLCGKYINPENLRSNTTFLYDNFRPVADFFQRSLNRRSNPPPFAARKIIWKIISNLINYSSRETSYDESYPGSIVMHSYAIAINTTKALALGASIEYALWCNKNLKRPNGKKLVKEVYTIINKLLDIDRSISIRGILGAYLPALLYLDSSWTQKNLCRIFGSDHNEKLYLAAWDSFLYHHRFKPPRKEMKRYYIEHIMKLKFERNDDELLINRMFVNHITIAYILDYRLGDELFSIMIENIHMAFIRHLIQFIGTEILGEYKRTKNTRINLYKIRNLWEDSRFKDCIEFGWWFINTPFSKRYSILRLQYSLQNTNGKLDPTEAVCNDLLNYIKIAPLQTLDCIKLMSIAYRENLGICDCLRRTAYDAISMIKLQKTSSRGNSAADSMIDYFGSVGFYEFRQLK